MMDISDWNKLEPQVRTAILKSMEAEKRRVWTQELESYDHLETLRQLQRATTDHQALAEGIYRIGKAATQETVAAWTQQEREQTALFIASALLADFNIAGAEEPECLKSLPLNENFREE